MNPGDQTALSRMGAKFLWAHLLNEMDDYFKSTGLVYLQTLGIQVNLLHKKGHFF